jgi:microcystin-dependent protein
VVVIDRGLATEEKVLISSRVGNSFNVLERAYDGSSAQTHALGAVVEHVLDAYTVEQANRYVNLQSAKGDLVSHDGTTTQKVGVGANGTVLIADSAQSSGIKWAQIEAGSISSGALTAIASEVELLITPSGVPAGVITQYAGSTAPTGWLLCQGQSLSTTTYASLFAAINYTYGGAGGSFNIPNLRGRVPVGLNTAEGEFLQLGQSGGSKTHTLTISEMPSHGHGGSATAVGDHVHSTTDFPIKSFNEFQAGTSAVGRQATPTNTGPGGAHSHTLSITNTGGGAAHQNLQPYIVVNYIIKV